MSGRPLFSGSTVRTEHEAQVKMLTLNNGQDKYARMYRASCLFSHRYRRSTIAGLVQGGVTGSKRPLRGNYRVDVWDLRRLHTMIECRCEFLI